MCRLYFQKLVSIACPELCVACIYRNVYRLYVQNFCVSCMSRNVCVAVCKNVNSGWINNPCLRNLLTDSALNFCLKASVTVRTMNLSSSDSAIRKNKINCTDGQNIILTQYNVIFQPHLRKQNKRISMCLYPLGMKQVNLKWRWIARHGTNPGPQCEWKAWRQTTNACLWGAFQLRSQTVRII
jgi:hypothetical protein